MCNALLKLKFLLAKGRLIGVMFPKTKSVQSLQPRGNVRTLSK